MTQLTDAIDAHCARFLPEDGPGFVLGVAQEGVPIYRRAFGLASLEHGVPNGFDTVFEAASVSKQVTGMAVQMLVADGKIALEDDVRLHLSDLPDFGVPITVAQCLYHTCGYRDWVEALGFAGRQMQDVSERDIALRWLQKQRGLNHAPGAEHFYCNTGYFILAELVTAVSGLSFAAFCKARIFEPLGMVQTHFRETLQAVIPNRAECYYREDGVFVPIFSNQAMPGATSLHTTMDDLLRLLGNYETCLVGGPEVIAAMHEPGRLSDGEVFPYGSGLEFSTYRGMETVWHTGGWAGYCSLSWRMPEKGLAIALLCNFAEVQLSEFWPPLADLFFVDAPEPVEAPKIKGVPLEVELQDLVGRYLGPAGPVIEMKLVDGAMRTGEEGGESIGLVPIGGLRLQIEGRADGVEFVRGDTGHISQYVARVNGILQPPRMRIEPKPLAPLEDYLWTFYSEELETVVTFSVQDDVLTGRSINHGDEAFVPVTHDVFIAQSDGPFAEVLRFERDDEGWVIAMTWSSVDARYQHFARLLGAMDG